MARREFISKMGHIGVNHVLVICSNYLQDVARKISISNFMLVVPKSILKYCKIYVK